MPYGSYLPLHNAAEWLGLPQCFIVDVLGMACFFMSTATDVRFYCGLLYRWPDSVDHVAAVMCSRSNVAAAFLPCWGKQVEDNHSHLIGQ